MQRCAVTGRVSLGRQGRPARGAWTAVRRDGPVADPALAATLQLVADTIVESLGFGVAVVNLVDDDQTMVVAAVAGPEDVRRTLLGLRQDLAGWSQLVEASEAWGELRFLGHEGALPDPDGVIT